MCDTFENLREKANRIRRKVLQTVYETGKGHIGGTFSCTDILVALYYGGVLRIDPQNPKWPDRDRLVIGKGHACLALYNILLNLGFLSASRLKEYGSEGSSLGGQLCIDTPGVEYNSGSLGNAFGIGAGMALAARMDGRDYRVFAIVGDGECDEGSIWESAVFASRNELINLVGIVDRNRLGVTDFVEQDKGGRLEDKFLACGWECVTVDGHDFDRMRRVLNDLDKLDRPLAVIADTVKGKGISFMENGIKWHHSVPNKDEFAIAMKELELESR